MRDHHELLLRGWTVSAAPAVDISAVLSPPTHREAVPVPSDEWQVLHPIDPTDPVGYPGRMVGVRLESGGVVEFGPGSQGATDPPPPSVSPIRLDLDPASALVLDARCWFRVPVRAAEAVVWCEVSK